MLKNKWILSGIAALAAFGLAFITLLTYLSFQLRDVKVPLINFLKSQIDGDLQIADAEVVFFPTGINLKDVKLYAPGDKTPAASVEKARLRFNLLPLIQKKIETRVTVIEPDIHLERAKDGTTNMERIFAPLMKGEKKQASTPIDQLWWKRLAVSKLIIQKAHFVSSGEPGSPPTELKDVNVEANDIRFESAQVPADIKIGYSLPRISKAPMELKMRVNFDDATQGLKISQGKFTWGPAGMNFGGDALLPTDQKKDVTLNLNFQSEPIDLKKLSKILVDPIPASGTLTFQGTVTGSAFDPVLTLILDSPALSAAGKSLSNLHAEVVKKGKPLQIQNTSFGIFGGSVGLSGQVMPSDPPAAQLNISLKSLSVAAASGSKGNPARLSGNLQMVSKNATEPTSYAGGGKISLGPIPLPVVNLQNQVKVGQVLAAGVSMDRFVNLGMLSSSANLVGNQVDAINASVRIGGNTITLAPFSLGNGHFSASGSGTVLNQKSITASGTATLNPGVTAQLFPDPQFRSAVTGGKGGLSVPFTLNGPLDNPDFHIDGGYISGLIARAATSALPRILMGGLQPNQMLGTALKNTPLADPKNPLSQILGTAQPPQSNSPSTARNTQPRQQKTQSTTQQKPKSLGDLLFGH